MIMNLVLMVVIQILYYHHFIHFQIDANFLHLLLVVVDQAVKPPFSIELDLELVSVALTYSK